MIILLSTQLSDMSTNDYNVTMNKVRIADFKSHLSEHLRKVRAGRSLTVLDRNTPIARVVPCEDDIAMLRIRKPLPGSGQLARVPLPPPLKLRKHKDIVTLLLEERQGER
jgi:prevent-host-death family protein